MSRFSLACLVLLTVCVYETEAQGDSITEDCERNVRDCAGLNDTSIDLSKQVIEIKLVNSIHNTYTRLHMYSKSTSWYFSMGWQISRGVYIWGCSPNSWTVWTKFPTTSQTERTWTIGKTSTHFYLALAGETMMSLELSKQSSACKSKFDSNIESIVKIGFEGMVGGSWSLSDAPAEAGPTEPGPTITIWKGNCRKGDNYLCRLKCKVVLTSGTLHRADINWYKEGRIGALPAGRLNADKGVYTAIIPGSWDVEGDYYCQYVNPDDNVATDSDTVITLALPTPDPITVTADVPTTTCMELGGCEISCAITGVDFRKEKKKKNETDIKFYKEDVDGIYQLLPKEGKIQRKRILLRWAKADGGVAIATDFGQYKCEYDGIRSAPLTLAVTPICYKPADPANGYIWIPVRRRNKNINIGDTYTVKCNRNAVINGNPVITCSGANDAAGVLSAMATCDIPVRSVTPFDSAVSCFSGRPCKFSCTIEGVIEVRRNGALVTPTTKKKWIWTKDGNDIPWHGRSDLDEKVMTYKIKNPAFKDAGIYRCGYDFGRNTADIKKSVITVTVTR